MGLYMNLESCYINRLLVIYICDIIISQSPLSYVRDKSKASTLTRTSLHCFLLFLSSQGVVKTWSIFFHTLCLDVYNKYFLSPWNQELWLGSMQMQPGMTSTHGVSFVSHDETWNPVTVMATRDG